jgi:hypothetical protein
MVPVRYISLSHRAEATAKGALWVASIFAFIVTLSTQANAGPNEDIVAAATAGDRAGVEAAFAAGASVNAVDPLGLPGQTTPLSSAGANGHRNVAEFLLDHGANVDGKDGLEQTPLHIAADHGSEDVAKLLLDRGANVDARDFLDATPLQYSALRGYKNIVVLLITHGAAANARSKFGKTALHVAATEGHIAIVDFLLGHGADANARNSEGQTPLQEMRTSSLDTATKAKIAALFGQTLVQGRKPVTATVPLPPPAPAAPLPAFQPPAYEHVGVGPSDRETSERTFAACKVQADAATTLITGDFSTLVAWAQNRDNCMRSHGWVRTQ